MSPIGPTITVSAPSEKEVTASPREYALFRQLDHSHKGQIPLEVCAYAPWKKIGDRKFELVSTYTIHSSEFTARLTCLYAVQEANQYVKTYGSASVHLKAGRPA